MLRVLLGRTVRGSSLLKDLNMPAMQWSPALQDGLCPPRSSFGVPFQIQGFKEDPNAEAEEREVGTPRVRQLVEDIVSLNLLEIADLTELLQKRLRVPPGGMGGGMPMMGFPSPGMGAPQPAAAAPPPVEEKPVEKTEFNIKLDGFDAASKIKVIKEVRALTSLGLKEAKELVEKAPTIVKEGVPKAEAEDIQKKLESAGGKVSLE